MTQSEGKDTEKINKSKYQDLSIRFQNMFSYVQVMETRVCGGGQGKECSPPFFKIFLEIGFSQMVLRVHARIRSSPLTSQPELQRQPSLAEL